MPRLLDCLVHTGLLSLLAATSLCGCSSKQERIPVHPVKGSVTFEGRPLANALIVLHPKSATGKLDYSSQGKTDASGEFQVTTYDTNDGAPVGDYAVTVQYYELITNGSSSEPGPNILAPKYATPQTTDIFVTVKAEPNVLPPINVSR